MLLFIRFIQSQPVPGALKRCGAFAPVAFFVSLFLFGCGGNGKLSNSQNASDTSGASNSVTFSKVQTSYWKWQGYGQIAPTFADCAAPCPESSWNQVFGVSSPSKSGGATEFQLNPKMPEADVLFTTTLIGQNSPYGDDADHTLLPSMHHFTYDADFYVPDPSIVNALEFDISAVDGQNRRHDLRDGVQLPWRWLLGCLEQRYRAVDRYPEALQAPPGLASCDPAVQT